MSHFTRVKTRIFDLGVAMQAAAQLNHRVRPTSVMRGWQGATRKVDLALETAGPYDIGLVKQPDGAYDFVADWWGVRTTTGIDQEGFTHRFLQAYATLMVTQQLKDAGLKVTEQTTMCDGAIYVCVGTGR